MHDESDRRLSATQTAINTAFGSRRGQAAGWTAGITAYGIPVRRLAASQTTAVPTTMRGL